MDMEERERALQNADPETTRGSAHPGPERQQPADPDVLDEELVEEPAAGVPRLDAEDEGDPRALARRPGVRDTTP
jgi:hypothetical protein